MSWQRLGRYFCLVGAIAWAGLPRVSAASEHHGQVTFGGLPVPGATVTAVQGGHRSVTITDQQGSYFFPDLADGTWKVEVEMLCFSTISQEVIVAPNTPAAKWDLKLLSLADIAAQAQAVKAETAPVLSTATKASEGKGVVVKPNDGSLPEMPKPPDEAAERSADGFLINGSVNNAATSQFTLAPAFGNRRSGIKGK